jgi:hypothetical protein
MKPIDALGRGLSEIFKEQADQGGQEQIIPDAALSLAVAILAIRDIVEEVPGRMLLSELVEAVAADYQERENMGEILAQQTAKIIELETEIVSAGEIIRDVRLRLDEALNHLRGA